MRQVLLSEKLLREYIANVLKENDGLGTGAGEYAGLGLSNADNPMAGGAPSGDVLSIFGNAFGDVAKTAAGETKKLAANVATVLRVAFEVIVTTFIPILGANYDAIFKRRDARIAKINQEYSDVYARTDAALASDDAKMFAFMFDPVGAMTAYAAKKSPKAIKGTLSVLTGGISDEIIEKAKSKAPKNVGDYLSESRRRGSSRHDLDWSLLGKSLLREDKEDEKKDDKKKGDVEKEAREFLLKLLQNEEVIKRLEKAPNVIKMKKQALAVNKETIKEIGEEVTSIKELTSLEKIEDYIKKSGDKKSKADEALKKIEEIKKIKDEKQKKAAVEKLAKTIKEKSKEVAMKRIKEEIDFLERGNIKKDSEVMKDYISAAQKIKSL